MTSLKIRTATNTIFIITATIFLSTLIPIDDYLLEFGDRTDAAVGYQSPSIFSKLSASEFISPLVLRSIANTFFISLLSIIWGTIVGIALGGLCAFKHRSILDVMIKSSIFIITAIPTLVLSIGLYWILSLYFQIDISFSSYNRYLPAVLILGLFAMCIIFKQTRTSILEEKNKEYVTLCYFKGLNQLQTYFKHIIPNILPTLRPTILLVFGSLLEGSLFTESIFGIEGLGFYLYNGIIYKKTEQLLVGVIIVSVIYATINAVSEYYARKNNIRYK